MRDKNGPQIKIDGGMMIQVPTDITIKQAFGNFEELVRGTQVAPTDRLRLIGSLVALGTLVEEGYIPKVPVREALADFEQIGMAFECNHHFRIALLKSVDILEDLVEVEEARLAEAESKSDEGSETDGPSETETGPEAVDEGQGSGSEPSTPS